MKRYKSRVENTQNLGYYQVFFLFFFYQVVLLAVNGWEKQNFLSRDPEMQGIVWGQTCGTDLQVCRSLSRLLGKISITSDMQMTPPLWQRVKNKRASWWKWKSCLKLNIQKIKITDHGIWSHDFMGNRWGKCHTLFWGVPKSLQMVIASMKLKDVYSSEGKLWPTQTAY